MEDPLIHKKPDIQCHVQGDSRLRINVKYHIILISINYYKSPDLQVDRQASGAIYGMPWCPRIWYGIRFRPEHQGIVITGAFLIIA